jgi:hypothetical protein
VLIHPKSVSQADILAAAGGQMGRMGRTGPDGAGHRAPARQTAAGSGLVTVVGSDSSNGSVQDHAAP